MLANKTKYAIKAMICLAREHGRGPQLISSLAQREQLPQKFLEAILLELRNAGWLESKKGRGGGYQILQSPRNITLGDIVRLMEGPLAPLACVSQTAYQRCADCADELTCGLRMVMRGVRDETARILDGTTLQDVIEQEDRARQRTGAVMFQI